MVSVAFKTTLVEDKIWSFAEHLAEIFRPARFFFQKFLKLGILPTALQKVDAFLLDIY